MKKQFLTGVIQFTLFLSGKSVVIIATGFIHDESQFYGVQAKWLVLYGCETWSLTLREELRLRVFENRVVRRVFGPKRDEVTGEWWQLPKEELNDLYC
jgi:hypothetical protein